MLVSGAAAGEKFDPARLERNPPFRYRVDMIRLAPLAAAAVLALASCSREPTSAVIMTDSPEFAFYVDTFNASQDRYRLELRFRPNVPKALAQETEAPPALAVGRFLANDQARSRFVNLDYLFRELIVNPSGVYQGLLQRGEFDGRQLLLPVSFNMPLAAWKRGQISPAKDNFVISLDEMRAAAADRNKISGSAFVRMGFSPRWDPDFLLLFARMSGTAFREGSPLSWSDEGLAAALETVRAWSSEVNRSAADEDDFQFKYLYLPRHLSVQEERIAFAYMDSSQFFLLSEERRAALEYRWIARGTAIPVLEEAVYAGILRRGRGRTAAESFLKWFFREETQRYLLEKTRALRTSETIFGIAGGFSSIRSVNEKVLPGFYPSLLGHLPPPEYIEAPPVLPPDWTDLAGRVLKPFLINAAGNVPPDFDPKSDLRRRMDQWKRQTAGS